MKQIDNKSALIKKIMKFNDNTKPYLKNSLNKLSKDELQKIFNKINTTYLELEKNNSDKEYRQNIDEINQIINFAEFYAEYDKTNLKKIKDEYNKILKESIQLFPKNNSYKSIEIYINLNDNHYYQIRIIDKEERIWTTKKSIINYPLITNLSKLFHNISKGTYSNIPIIGTSSLNLNNKNHWLPKFISLQEEKFTRTKTNNKKGLIVKEIKQNIY